MKTWLRVGNTYAEVFYDQYEDCYPLFFMRPSKHTEAYADYYDTIASGGWVIETCHQQDRTDNAVGISYLSHLTLREFNHMLLPNIFKTQGDAIEAMLKSIDIAVTNNVLENPEVYFVGCGDGYVQISMNDEAKSLSLDILIVKIEAKETHDYWKKALIHAEEVCELYNGTNRTAGNPSEAR